MGGLGPPVLRSSVRALWLGRMALGVVFAGLFFGGATAAGEALFLSLGVTLAAGVAWILAPSPVPLRRVGWPALAFAVVIGVAILTVVPLPTDLARSGLYGAVGGRSLSIAPAATFIEIAKLFGLGCVFLCGVFAGRGERTPGRLLDACIVFTALWAGWSLILFAATGGQARLGAPLLSPNTAATLLGVGWIVTVGRLLAWREARLDKSAKRWTLTWLAAAFVVIGVALALTQSRAGLGIAVLCAIGLTACWPARPGAGGLSKRGFALAGVAFALAIALEAGRGVLLRLPGLAAAAADRREIFATYWAAFCDAPVFGGGLGSATYVTKLGLTPQTYDALWNVQSAHNWGLQWLAEGGVAAALPMGTAVAGLLIAAFRGLDVRSARLLLPLLFADAMVLTHGLTDFALQIPAFALYWSFLLGLQTAVSSPQARRSIRSGGRAREEAGR